MQSEKVSKEGLENLPDDTHIMHSWEPCKFEITEDYKFVHDNFIFNTCSNLLYLIAFPLVSLIDKFFFNFRVEGRENLENIDTGKITVSNHIHYMDCTMVGLGNFPQKTFFTTLETNFKIPIVRKLIKLLNAIPIPKNIKYTKNFMNSIDTLLQEKKTIHFYPEGSLWPYYDKIRHFKNGAFDFAVRNNVPIVPMVFKYVEPKNISNLIKTKPYIKLVILEPVYPNKLLSRGESVIDLKNRVHNIMEEKLRKKDYH